MYTTYLSFFEGFRLLWSFTGIGGVILEEFEIIIH